MTCPGGAEGNMQAEIISSQALKHSRFHQAAALRRPDESSGLLHAAMLTRADENWLNQGRTRAEPEPKES